MIEARGVIVALAIAATCAASGLAARAEEPPPPVPDEGARQVEALPAAAGASPTAKPDAGPKAAQPHKPADAPAAPSTSPPPASAGRKPPGGWREMTRNGTVYWCKSEILTGSRVKRAQLCMTPAQFAAMQDANKAAMEDMTSALPAPSD